MAPKDDSLYLEKRGKKIVSTVGLNYFTSREKLFISGDEWLEGKRTDDDLSGLWRIHNKVYDLERFIKKHPGGPEWLTMTKVNIQMSISNTIMYPQIKIYILLYLILCLFETYRFFNSFC